MAETAERFEDFERPVDRVYKALPGTLQDLAERTGYPPSTIVQMIGRLRAEGVVVACEPGERDLESAAGWEPSHYILRAPVDGR